MPLSCHRDTSGSKEKTEFTIALAGNPNVGKSSIFNQITGLEVLTAHYPGKTVELNIGMTNHHGHSIKIIDLPGTYALGAVSDDQWVARRTLLEKKPDLVVIIADATNLQRNLFLAFQLLDMDIPAILDVNLVDQALKAGILINYERLSVLLGIPVIPTVATRGEGLKELMNIIVQIIEGNVKISPHHPSYGKDIVSRINQLSDFINANLRHTPFNLSSRAISMLLLERDSEFLDLIKEIPGGDYVLNFAMDLIKSIEDTHGEPVNQRIARERHGLAGTIVNEIQDRSDESLENLSSKLWHYSIEPLTGIPILISILLFTFGFLFYAGDFLSNIFNSLWGKFISPVIDSFLHLVFGTGILGKSLIWAFDAGIQAALAVGIPYVFTFYFILAILEDTGYLNSMAFLTDSLMHKFGLHGRSAIAIVAAAGCNVPAIIGTRVLSSMRERIIASTLIVLIPCSARTAVIMGAVASYIGWIYGLSIFIITILVTAMVGIFLNMKLPGKSTGLVMEIFPFRMPMLQTIIKKTWYRFKDFVFVATPIVLLGSFGLGILYESGLIWKFSYPLKPIVEWWLGLPAAAGLCLIFAILRKELALQLLTTLAIVQYGPDAKNLLHFMNPDQLFIYALVNTLYIPCAATIAILARELGWYRTLYIVIFTVLFATLIGGITRHLLAFY